MPCWASPPGTFCQEKVAASSFVQSIRLREHRRGRVADGQAFAVASDPVGIGHADAGGRAVPGEHDVAVAIDLAEIGQLAVRRKKGADVFDLELIDEVGHPLAAERLPGEHVDAARPEQRPERHLDGAGVGSGHDRHAVIGGKLERSGRALDRKREPRFRLGPAMVAPDKRALEAIDGPAGMLGARPGREARIAWPQRGLGGHGHESRSPVRSDALGRLFPIRPLRSRRRRRSARGRSRRRRS